MKILSDGEIFLPTTPAVATTSDGRKLTETFSTRHRNKLRHNLLREIAAAFMTADGLVFSSLKNADRELNVFCQFLVDIGRGKSLTSLKNLTTEVLYEYLEYLKRNYPPQHQADGKTTHPWYVKWKHFKARMAPLLGIEKFPWCPKPEPNVTDGHTPYAMGMFLDALRAEIDCIRAKLESSPSVAKTSRWQAAAGRGRILDLEWFDRMTPGSSSQFTEQQLDELENLIFEPQSGRKTDVELASKYNVQSATIRTWRKYLKRGEIDKRSPLAKLTHTDFEKVKTELLAPKAPSYSDIANTFGITRAALASFKRRWTKAGRKNGRPKPKFSEDDIDLTLDDVIATINHYLPDWPMIGKLGSEDSQSKMHRVYQTECGVLLGTFEKKREAEKFAKECGGVVVSGLLPSSDNRRNPAEILFAYRRKGMRKQGTPIFLSRKLADLFPNGFDGLVDEYFPTTYDWTVVLLYWLCLTGWNLEAISSVSVFDLISQIKGPGPHDILSREHATFSVEIAEKEADDIQPMITGEKKRGQAQDNPKYYTHVSDRKEEYGLFRVLEDYYTLTKPFRDYLERDEINCILFGVGGSNSSITQLNRDQFTKNRSFRLQISSFLKKNEIYDDEDHIRRIEKTGPMNLRVTYLNTLKSLGVPIGTLAFLAGHKSVDTTLVHYSSGQHSVAIKRGRCRELLNSLAHKAFSGKLVRYEQVRNSRKSKEVQVFSHRENDITICEDRFNPTWEGNEEYLQRTDRGKTRRACDYFEMCLLCKKSIVTEDTLPYLVRWRSDIREWRREYGGAGFPHFMQKQFNAIEEIFELCEAEGPYWQEKLREAEERAFEGDFCAPPIWRGI